MSEKHTPGPWFVDTDGDQTIDTHWGVVSKHNDLWVAACYRSGTTPRDEKSPEADAEAKANAALIARAPTLAAEVERLRAEAASFHMDYRMKCDEETKRLAVEVERLRADLAAMTADRDSWADQAEQRVADWDAERRKVEALRKAGGAVVARWDSPRWEWAQQGPTADLIAELRAALAATEGAAK